MAKMTPRQKKGLGFIISGFLFMLTGGVLTWTTQSPEWLDITLQIAGLVAGVFGINLEIPKRDE